MISKLSDKITVISHTQSSNIYYLDYDRKVIIDTGHSAERKAILDDMHNCDMHIENVENLLITHAHIDHIGNAACFKSINPQIRIAVSDNHEQFLQRLNDFNTAEDIDSHAECFKPDKILHDGDKILLDDKNVLEVIATPGHTSDGISFWLPSEGMLFSGDTVYNGVVPQLDIYQPLPLGLKWLTDTYQRLEKLPIRMICPGHGHTIENAAANFEALSRKLRKFAASPDMLIINNLIPTVEHYINDHPGVTQQNIIDYFEIKYKQMFDKGFADFDKPVSPYSVIINKVIMMMQFLKIVTFAEDGTALLVGEVNHYIKG